MPDVEGYSRRRLLQAMGVTGGTALLGFGAAETSDHSEFHAEFANRRVQEAKKAWAKGFRGQPNRALGILGTGLEARHPDLGPWNGIRAVPDGDNGLELVKQNFSRLTVPDDIKFFEGSIPPNAGNVRHEYPFTGPQDVHRVEAHLRSYPFAVSNSLILLLETADGEVIEKHGGVAPHTGLAARIEPGKDYVYAVETTTTNNYMSTRYDLEANYLTDNTNGQVTDPFANVDPDNITPNTPKTVGWYNEDYSISEPTAKPLSGPDHGHGTQFASVIAGSGRASAIDEATVTEDAPRKTLQPGDDLTYKVKAKTNRGVYGVALGKNIEVTIIGPTGQRIDHHHLDSTMNHTSNMAESPTVHDFGTKIYKVVIRHRERDGGVLHLRKGKPGKGVGYVKRVSVGAFKCPKNTTGDRTDEDENPTLHAGVSPNSALVGISGFLKTRKNLSVLATDFARIFNLRVLDIMVGFKLRPGFAAGKFSAVKVIKALAKEGILTVSRTGDIGPAYHKDRAPATADEAISVAQTGPNDGVWTMSTSQPGAIDEDGEDVYLKPDVTAPGGRFVERLKSAAPGDAFRPEDQQSPIRDYSQWGWVSMQPPFVAGMAGLVAQAMEEEAPPEITLPPPEKSGFADTMRLKQIILATASETPYTAAGWHRREPQYNFGGHDPIEGWGRVNIDAAVEAASRDITPDPSPITVKETVGLDVPRHSRAVAGYISGVSSVYQVSVNFSRYTGDDKQRPARPPHLDLFIYDAENPGQHGTPNIVAKTQALKGSATLQFTTNQQTEKGTGTGTYYVVAKLVNVPGAVNSYDIRAHFNLTVKQVGRAGNLSSGPSS